MFNSDRGMKGLYIFVLVLNLVFPVMTYTFTTFSSSPEDYEMDLDADALMMAGINLVDAESHNLSYNGGWQYWTDINVTIRAQFMDDVRDPWYTVLGDGIGFQKQTAVGKAFNSWGNVAMVYRVSIKSVITNTWMKWLSNDTIVRDYNSNYNWSQFILKDGHYVFITPFQTHGNITQAVYVDANLNCTIAKAFASETNFNFWRFIGWYTSLMIGAESWGLPGVFSWVLRILGGVSLFAIVMLTKELIKL